MGVSNRTVTGRVSVIQEGDFAGAGGCLGDMNGTDISVDTTIVYTLAFYRETGNRYQLTMSMRLCGYNSPAGVRYAFQPGASCDQPWAGIKGVFSGYGGSA